MNENLKIQALKESISNLVANYEEKVADLRVEVTVLTQEKQQLQADNDRLAAQIETDSNEVVEGEVQD